MRVVAQLYLYFRNNSTGICGNNDWNSINSMKNTIHFGAIYRIVPVGSVLGKSCQVFVYIYIYHPKEMFYIYTLWFEVFFYFYFIFIFLLLFKYGKRVTGIKLPTKVQMCITDVYWTGGNASAVSKSEEKRDKIDMPEGVEGWNLGQEQH